MTTYKQVEAEMLKLVKAQPDFNYRAFRLKQVGNASVRVACAYVDEDGVPSCLWGQALVNAGVPIEEVQAYEGDAIDHVFDALEIDADRDEKNFAFSVQSNQDTNMDWDSALNNALEDTGYELVYTS